MFTRSFTNPVLKDCQQGANKHLRVIEIICRHLAYGVNFRACPLCSVEHTSMYLNGQAEILHRCILAPAPCGHFFKEVDMN